jgi:uncharacterized protein (TIGR03084 family)
VQVSRVGEVLADLRAEGDRLDALVAALPDTDGGGWRTPTPAAGWDVAHQIAHLAWTDETAVAAATDPAGWDAVVQQAIANPDGFVDEEAARGAAVPAAQLLSRWRAARAALAETLAGVPEGTRIPWYGPPMSAASMATARFMETWAHGRDVADALGVDLPPDDRVRHVVHIGVRTRGYAYRNHGLEPPAAEPRVELTLPGGQLLGYGPVGAAQSVTGPAHDFALVVTRRLHRSEADLTVVGADAEQWLEIAQAFAGPPGSGRPARG